METLAQFQWRYRDQMMDACEGHGVMPSVLLELLDELNVECPPWSPGMPVSSEYDRNRLPEGAVLAVGQPHRYETYGVFVKTAPNKWTNVLGQSLVPVGHTQRGATV